MSGQGNGSTRSLSVENAPQAPQQQEQPQPQQPHPNFNRGRTTFDRIRADEAQEYKNFKNLDETEMAL